jgi:hypothetical protein
MQRTDNQQLDNANTMNNALKGAIAGAIGVWVMDRLDWFAFDHEDAQARRRTEEVRPAGLDPAHVAASKAANMMGTELHPAQPHPAGVAIHYALGIGPGAIYGALRNRLPVKSQSQDFLYGIGLGLGLFLVQDEGLNQFMGLSGKQKDYPWQAHARGLAAHLTLGLVANAVLNLLNAPRPVPRQAAQSHRSLPHRENNLRPMASSGDLEAARTSLHS